MTTSEIALLIQRFGAALGQLSPSDIKLLVANKASMNIVIKRETDQQKVVQLKRQDALAIDLPQISSRLDVAETRAHGVELLKEFNKVQLQAIAKHISVSVDNSASKDRLIEKIVERKVGLKLRQDAFAQAMHVS